MKNTKNLKGLLIAFTLILITGVAFAIVAQDLTIGGTVSFQQIAVKLEASGANNGVSKSDSAVEASMTQNANGYDLDFSVAFTDIGQSATFTFVVKNESGFTVRPTANATDSLGDFITLLNDDPDKATISPSISIGGTYDAVTVGLEDQGSITAGSSSSAVTIVITCEKVFATPINLSLTVKYVQA